MEVVASIYCLFVHNFILFVNHPGKWLIFRGWFGELFVLITTISVDGKHTHTDSRGRGKLIGILAKEIENATVTANGIEWPRTQKQRSAVGIGNFGLN